MSNQIVKRTVGARGPEDSPFVIVGEAPGKEELKYGLPFVGPSGQVLHSVLGVKVTEPVKGHLHFQYPDTYPEPYLTNTYKSLITSAKDPAYLSALAMECRPALLEEIKKHPRKVIFAAGSVALQALTGDTSVKITKARGTLYPSELAEVGIVAGVHPAFLLRGNGSFRQFRADLTYAMDLASGKPPHPWHAPTWSVVTSVEEIRAHREIIKSLPEGSFVAADIETTGFSHRQNKILNLGYTWDGKHVYIINGHKTDALKDGIPNLIEHCHLLWDDIPQVRWVWHNGKFDCKFFHHIGQTGARVDDDTMLMSYALDEMRGLHDLETVSGDWLGSPNWKGTLDEFLPNKKTTYDAIPHKVLFKYAAYDIGNTFNLAGLLWSQIIADPIAKKQYTKTLIPASAYLMAMELRGIYIDQDQVAANRTRIQAEAQPYIETIVKIAEEAAPGNWSSKMVNSHVQLSSLIFDVLKVPYKNPKSPKIRSTSDDILDKLYPHPVIIALRKYRKLAKADGTYVKPYTQDPEKGCIQDDGRIHTSYLLHGTATGRLASRDPNLQNIPRDPLIRGQFVAPPGRMFIEPDLNQAELRSLAVLSGDPELCKIYIEATESLHEKVRRQIFGNPSDWSALETVRYLDKFNLTEETRFDKVTGEDRIVGEQKMKAKNVNFGIIYGITETGLSEQTGEVPSECKHWLDVWAKTFPVAWDFIKRCRNAPLTGSNLVTTFGYRKRFQIVTPEIITSLQNESANFPHQNTASVITMHGGIRTYKRLEEWDAFYVNTVHDSLLIEAPHDPVIAAEITEYVTGTLEQVPRDWGLTRIPFVADAKYGTRWGSMTSASKYKGWVTDPQTASPNLAS